MKNKKTFTCKNVVPHVLSWGSNWVCLISSVTIRDSFDWFGNAVNPEPTRRSLEEREAEASLILLVSRLVRVPVDVVGGPVLRRDRESGGGGGGGVCVCV